eukprot:351987-Chlamydomonas_euryale.AAC.3
MAPHNSTASPSPPSSSSSSSACQPWGRTKECAGVKTWRRCGDVADKGMCGCEDVAKVRRRGGWQHRGPVDTTLLLLCQPNSEECVELCHTEPHPDRRAHRPLSSTPALRFDLCPTLPLVPSTRIHTMSTGLRRHTPPRFPPHLILASLCHLLHHRFALALAIPASQLTLGLGAEVWEQRCVEHQGSKGHTYTLEQGEGGRACVDVCIRVSIQGVNS